MRVGIIGGGMAGLVAALDLVDAGADVTLFEVTPNLGGQVQTRRDAGFIVEDGAEGWVSGDTELPKLCASLGVGSELVNQVERRSLFLSRGNLTQLKSGDAARLLGIQAGDSDLGRGIASLRSGMGTLVEALDRRIRKRAAVRTNCAVVSAARHSGGWRLGESGGGMTQVDAVIGAGPAAAIATLLQSLAGDAAQELRRIEVASSVSVSIGYDREAVEHPLDASGFVVDAVEKLDGLRACAFSSSKLPNRAPAGRVLLRAFFRPDEDAIDEDDQRWSERAVRLLAPVLGLSGSPVGTWVARWPGALPQYSPSHRERLDRVAARLRELGNVELAGTNYQPGGIPGAVRSGRAAAERLLATK
jgi:oxygen-dependent protoporphyrinogen oxidase